MTTSVAHPLTVKNTVRQTLNDTRWFVAHFWVLVHMEAILASFDTRFCYNGGSHTIPNGTYWHPMGPMAPYWGLSGTIEAYGFPFGPVGTYVRLGERWGRVGSFGDLSGLMGTYGYV